MFTLRAPVALRRSAMVALVAASLLGTAASLHTSAAHASPYWYGDVSLDASDTGPNVGDTISLTARTTQSVSRTPYYIYILDETSGSVLRRCGRGYTCSVSVTRYAAETDTFLAEVARPGRAPMAESDSVDVTWQDVPSWSIDLTPSDSYPSVDDTITLDASASADVYGTGYHIYIIDETTGDLVAQCDSGDSCSGDVTRYAAETDTFVAEVSQSRYASPVTESSTVDVSWT